MVEEPSFVFKSVDSASNTASLLEVLGAAKNVNRVFHRFLSSPQIFLSFKKQHIQKGSSDLEAHKHQK